MIKLPDNKFAIRAYSFLAILALPLFWGFGLCASLLLSVKDAIGNFAHLFYSHQKESYSAVKLAFGIFRMLVKSLKTGQKNTDDDG